MNKEIIKKVKDFYKNNIPKTRIIDGGEDYIKHVELVRKYSIELGKVYGADLFVVEVASYLHDVGADAGLVHEEESAKIAKRLLDQEGIDSNTKRRILSAILHHSMAIKGKEFVESVVIEDEVVRDADGLSFLEDTYKFFIKKRLTIMSKEEAKKLSLDKIKAMLDKIQTEKGKKIAKSFYQKAIDYIKAY